MEQYFQNYNPTGNVFLSTFVAALPIITLLYLLAIHPHKTKDGRTELGIFAPYAAIASALVAFIVCIFIAKMPAGMALSSFLYGAASGLFPIGWIVFSAIFLYNTTLVTGKFEVLKDSVAGLTPDKRLQALLISYAFGAFMEGACGFGTPVAVSGAIMVGLGFAPMTSAVICLIANTAPVAFGAIGVPIITLGQVTNIPDSILTQQAGLQLVFMPIVISFWLVATLVFMDKGKWSEVWEVWPATLVCGGSFAIAQWFTSQAGWTMIVDIIAGVVAMIATVLFLKIWKPKNIIGHANAPSAASKTHATSEVITAWMPWVLLGISVFVIGLSKVKAFLNGIFIWKYTIPTLDKLSVHTPPVGDGVHGMAAVYSWNILTMGGTGIMLAAVISGLFVLRLSGKQWGQSLTMTVVRMKVPLSVICTVLGLGYMTRYAGTDAILGLAFTKTGSAYPFFATMLGWLGVFLTGSDTAANSMFGNLQRITAEQLGLNPVPIVTANSTGGVMGKMIDAQSIVVSTVACYENHHEGMAAVGPIFRAVVWHSLALALLLSAWIWFQINFLPSMLIPMPK